ncbi:MAG TPA: hypothetical protein VG498_04720 [Terriglobales bacterium]|nr:hypothetical protein [Terriglobales bacterium]
MKRLVVIAFSALLFSGFCVAQSTEIGFLAGGIFTSDKTPTPGTGTCPATNPSCGATIHTPARISYEGIFAHRLVNFHVAGLHLEFPVVGTPTRSIVQGGFRQDFSTIYFTPGLRLQLGLPFFQPFVSAGGGFGHYSASSSVGSSTVGAFQVGGGIDLGFAPFLHFRVEAREFHNGSPDFNVGNNNIFAGGGLVLKF